MHSLRLTTIPLCLLLASLATADVHVMTASLDGAQGVPPVTTAGTGNATITVDDASGYVHVEGSYGALNGSASASHLHGLAASGANAGVLFPLMLSGTTSGTFSGSAVLSAAQVAGVLAGQSYINVHTSAHPGGEIRGQVLHPPHIINGALDGAQANIVTAGVGTFSVTVDKNTGLVDVAGTYSGLSGTVGAAHLHGPAWFGQGGGVLIPLANTGGTSGTFSGSATLAPGAVDDVLDGFSYVNVHTTVAPAGEIRGQVFGPFLGTAYCTPVPNSSGTHGTLVATGSPRVVDNDLTLQALDLPVQQFGYFIASRGSTQVLPVANSQGRLCIGGSSQARFTSTIASSGAAGTILAQLDLTSIPANPTVAAAPGETWNFQLWHRDLNPTTTSNFTSAVSISFR